MPFQGFQTPQVPTTKQDVRNEYARTDGECDVHEAYVNRTGASSEADFHQQEVRRSYELACGCASPPAEVAGICAVCAAEKRVPEVCAAHFVVCECGAARCFHHTHAIDSGRHRQCERCHLRAENQAFKPAHYLGHGGFVHTVLIARVATHLRKNGWANVQTECRIGQGMHAVDVYGRSPNGIPTAFEITLSPSNVVRNAQRSIAVPGGIHDLVFLCPIERDCKKVEKLIRREPSLQAYLAGIRFERIDAFIS